MKEINNEVTRYLLQCEKEALMGVNSPYVLKSYDIYEEQQYCYIVTPYCEGGSLKDLIVKRSMLIWIYTGNLSEVEALTIFHKLLLGYKSIKDCHFVHRDLKSCNVMLKKSEPIIIDFGYCEKTYGQKPRVYYNVGSPSYMPPEAFYKSVYSEKSDIWSLGIILFEMLAGYTIDKGEPINRYFSSLIKQGYKLPKHISPSCEQILAACLKINPQHRIRTNELLTMLENYFSKQEWVPVPMPLQQKNIDNVQKIQLVKGKPAEQQSQQIKIKENGSKKQFFSLKSSITGWQTSKHTLLSTPSTLMENKQPSTCTTITQSLSTIPSKIHPEPSTPVGRKELHMAKMTESFIHQEVPMEQAERVRGGHSVHISQDQTAKTSMIQTPVMSIIHPSPTQSIIVGKPKVQFQCVQPPHYAFLKKPMAPNPHRAMLTINRAMRGNW